MAQDALPRKDRSALNRSSVAGRLAVGLNAVIIAVTDERPRILVVGDAGSDLDTLPYGPLDLEGDRTLELTLRGWVRERTGLELGYVEQLYTFGDRDRGRRRGPDDPRILSIAYLALVRESPPKGDFGASWQDIYRYLPWEDWRKGRPRVLSEVIVPQLDAWIDAAPDDADRHERALRAVVAFGRGGNDWDGDRVLERYELLYSIGLVSESIRERDLAEPDDPELPVGRPMALDHRRMLATALGRIRGKTRYRPVVFELLPPRFTLLQLQRVVEALAGVRTHKQNFRRLVERGGLVEGTGAKDSQTGGRPAELFRFRKEVLRERRAPGVGLPGS